MNLAIRRALYLVAVVCISHWITASSGYKVQPIHPAIRTAYVFQESANVVDYSLSTKRNSLTLTDNMAQLDFGQFQINESTIATHDVDDQARAVTAESDLEYVRQMMQADNGKVGKESFATTKLDCNFQSFRAYETFKWSTINGNIGITESMICIYISEETPGEVRNYAFEREKLNKSMVKAYATVAGEDVFKATAVAYSQRIKQIIVFDEIGQFHFIKHDEGFNQFTSEPSNLLSIYKFNDNPVRSAAIEGEPQINEAEVTSLQRHFQYNFIESISFHDQRLCYSRGLFRPNKKMLTCLKPANSSTTSRGLLSRLAETEQRSVSVLAMEVITDQSGAVHAHVVYNLITGSSRADSVMSYQYSKFNSMQEASSRPIEANARPAEGQLIVGLTRAPNDLVHHKTDQCDQLLVFYPHMVQLYAINNLITNAPFQSASIERAELFPVDAAFAHGNTFYLFSSENTLNIIEPGVTVSDTAKPMCLLSFARSVAKLRKVYASEFMLRIERMFSGQRPVASPQNLPVFTGQQMFEGVRKVNFENDPEYLKLESSDFSFIAGFLPPPGSEPDEDPAPTKSDGLSATLIIVILLVLLAIISGLVYYFFVHSSRPRAPKSRRALKSSAAIASQPDASLISAVTVRSSMAGNKSATSRPSLASTALSPAASGVAVVKSKKSLAATKSVKSRASKSGFRRSPANSPRATQAR